MRFQLRPNENVLHPNPYVEDERPQLIITTARVMYSGAGKKQEFESGQITYSGKGNDPKIMKLLVVFAIFALPFIIGGLVLAVPNRPPILFQGAPWGPEKPDPKNPKKIIKPYSQRDLDEMADRQTGFIIGTTLLVFGAIFAGAGYLLYKRRLCVMLGGAGRRMRIRVQDKNEQEKVLTMVGASQMSAKAMVAATAKPKPGAPAAPAGAKR